MGEALLFEFRRSIDLRGVELVNGYAKSPELHARNGRLSQVLVVTDAGRRRTALRDSMREFQQTAVVPGPTRTLRLEIDGVFGGTRYADTLISEVSLRVAR